MELGLIGLGKMGLNMSIRLSRGGHTVFALDNSEEARTKAAADGATPVVSVKEMVSKMKAPRAIWIMVPSGSITESVFHDVLDHVSAGDIIIDGGNSNYKDDIRRADVAAKKGVKFLDAGTSGGVWGLQNGYCLMVGGDKSAYDAVYPVFKTLAPPDGCEYMGAVGAGHFTKMIHNGIEYGMMQSYAEGFEILEKSPYKIDMHQVAHLWNQGSVVRSWLLELAEDAFKKDPKLESIKGYVADSGEGRWTVQAAIDEDVPAPVLTLSLFQRFVSREENSFAARVLAALRNEFGGHAVKKAGE
jgi:6-phosphogluconate dehydrogenase